MEEGRRIKKSKRIRRYSYIFMSERGETCACSEENIPHLSISPFQRMQPILTLLPLSSPGELTEYQLPLILLPARNEGIII